MGIETRAAFLAAVLFTIPAEGQGQIVEKRKLLDCENGVIEGYKESQLRGNETVTVGKVRLWSDGNGGAVIEGLGREIKVGENLKLSDAPNAIIIPSNRIVFQDGEERYDVKICKAVPEEPPYTTIEISASCQPEIKNKPRLNH